MSHKVPTLRHRAASFDHLVGADEERRRDRQAKGLRGLEIDRELKLRGLLYRKVGWLLALEDLVDEACESEIEVRVVHAVGYQSPGLDEVAGWIDRRKPIAGRQVNDRLLMRLGETVCPNDTRVDMLSDGQFECAA